MTESGIYQPAWSKDGTRIMYVRNNAIWIIGADGEKPERILGPFPEQKKLFSFYGFDYRWGNTVNWEE